MSVKPRDVVILMDTTYFGRTLAVMLFKDAYSGENLLKKYVRYETNNEYFSGIKELSAMGYNIKAIVCDGRKGLFQLFNNIPVQMCQYHQVKIITRYLTKKPKHQASKELRELSLLLSDTDKDSFIEYLDQWHIKWEDFLNERFVDINTGKSHYLHRRLRSAYRSLTTNLKWLFACYDHVDLNIPNTTNAIDGIFGDLKNKLRNHNGLSIDRKKKFIDEFFKV
jgi:hypothetical protein